MATHNPALDAAVAQFAQQPGPASGGVSGGSSYPAPKCPPPGPPTQEKSNSGLQTGTTVS